MDDIKNIDELIDYLKKVKEEQGNITVCYTQPHEYWGSTESYLRTGYSLDIKRAQPEGPKSGKSELCVVFGTSY